MLRLSGGINRGAVFVAVSAVAMLLACATTPESDPADTPDLGAEVSVQDTQELGGVDVESIDGETRIVLEGLQDPVYTVEQAVEGNGLVVELTGVSQPSASLFDALAESSTQVSVYDGVVDMVSASTFAGDGAPVTRIEVALAVPAQIEVQSSARGLDLVVRADSEMAASDGQAVDELAMGESAAAAVDPWAVAESIGGVDAVEATDAGEPAHMADETGGAVLELDQDDIGDTAAVIEARSSEPATMLNSVSIETAEAGVLLHLEANGMLSSAETFTLENPDRLVVDLPGIESGVTKERISIDSQWVSRVRIGSHPDKLRVVLDGGPSVDGFQGRRVLPAADGLIMTIGAGADLDEALAAHVSSANTTLVVAGDVEVMGELAETNEMGDTPEALVAADNAEEASSPTELADASADMDLIENLDAKDPAAQDAAWDAMAAGETVPAALSELDEGMSGEPPAEIFGLQYDRDAERDRIAVLGDRVVDYEVLTPDAETVVVRIENAVVANRVGERITPDAGGPVSLVSTFQQPDVQVDEVRVVVRRASGLEPQVTRRGSLIFLDFPNTGLAAAPPPAFIPGEPKAVAQSEDYANALEVIGPDGETAALGIMDDPMSDAGTELAATLADDESYTALPAFEEPAAMGDGGPIDDMPMAMGDDGALPASLEGPAAVDMLEEGGLIDGKQYNGRRISLDFKDVLIADVLRLIAEVSDLNIIAGDEVQGTVTIRLVDVPWDQALDVILLTKGLGFVRVGNVLRIAPGEILKVEEEVRLQERRNKEKLEDLEVKLQPVNYASVEDVSDLVKRLLSARGTVNTDKRTNTVIIKDISSVIDEATALIQAIDTQTPQVLIEAKIVEANLEFGRELGSTWSFGSQPWTDGFNPGTPRTDLGGQDFKWQGTNNVAVGNPITSIPTGAVNFGAFLIDEKMAVDVHIEAMERAGDGKVVSSPRVVTLDNREALIEQGVSIPFQTFEGGDAKLEFIDAVLSLKVTPHITTDKSIIMSLEVTRNAPDSSVSTPTGSPAIAKNQAKTETLVKDGQTLVIGGIYTIDKSTRESRVPYLHRIPVIGAAFKSREISDSRKELLIFVTPRIVVNPALAAAG